MTLAPSQMSPPLLIRFSLVLQGRFVILSLFGQSLFLDGLNYFEKHLAWFKFGGIQHL
ncbi:hypothetical protein ACE6H2_018322 [Prunus campanulata]